MSISFNFNTLFCPALASLKQEFPCSEADTVFRTNAMAKSLKTDTLFAEMMANLYEKISTYSHITVVTGTLTDGKKISYAEYQKNSSDSMQISICLTDDMENFEIVVGKMKGASVEDYGTGHKGSVILLSMLPFITQEAECKGFADTIDLEDLTNPDFARQMCGLCNNIYYRYKYADKQTHDGIYVKSEKPLTQAGLKDVEKHFASNGYSLYLYSKETKAITLPAFSDIDEEEDDSTVVNAASMAPSSSKKKTQKTKGIRNKFRFDKSWKLSSEEEKRVPELGDWFVVPKIADELAQKIALSRDFRKPIDTVLLYGPSGTGKTEICKAVAAELGMPYYSICPGPDADKTDITDSFVPQTEEDETLTTEEIIKSLGIPSFDDVENDYENSFEALFGKKPDKFSSPADCYNEILKRVMESRKPSGRDFIHVETELVKAFRSGGLLEIQEPDVIKRASVLTFLNPILNGNGKNDFIQLSTGEILRRNKNCIVFFTTNRNYDGCNELQQSIYSRISLVREIQLPEADVLVQRTKADTGFPDLPALKKMAEMVYNIHSYCIEKDITTGVCGPRELYDWAVDAMVIAKADRRTDVTEEDIIKAALETVIASASQVEDDVEDIIHGVFLKTYSVSLVNAIRAKM